LPTPAPTGSGWCASSRINSTEAEIVSTLATAQLGEFLRLAAELTRKSSNGFIAATVGGRRRDVAIVAKNPASRIRSRSPTPSWWAAIQRLSRPTWLTLYSLDMAV
jgi:hypothetical protein